MKLKLITISFLLLQACAGAPIKTEEIKSATVKGKNTSSAMSIKSDRERRYAQKLHDLKLKNPVAEAQRDISRGSYYLMGYSSGRRGEKVFPGLSLQQATNSSCGFKNLDGFGDVLYGRNHLEYRKEMKIYASQFNRTMIASCTSNASRQIMR